MGVSICLDVVSIETLDLGTKKKSVSTVEISRHQKKVSLDNREISILSRHHLPVPKVSTETEKSVKT
jgi:hypothetical protein